MKQSPALRPKNMHSDSESQRDTERETEWKQEGRDNVCVCVWAVSLLWMLTCESDIRVLHLTTGADGSINRTSVCSTTAYPGQVSVCVCYNVHVKTFTCTVPFSLQLSVGAPLPSSFPSSYKCFGINYIVISNSVRHQTAQRRQTCNCFSSMQHRSAH